MTTKNSMHYKNIAFFITMLYCHTIKMKCILNKPKNIYFPNHENLTKQFKPIDKKSSYYKTKDSFYKIVTLHKYSSKNSLLLQHLESMGQNVTKLRFKNLIEPLVVWIVDGLMKTSTKDDNRRIIALRGQDQRDLAFDTVIYIRLVRRGLQQGFPRPSRMFY